jgi:uncharacterized protein YyaL (SSP411 family)
MALIAFAEAARYLKRPDYLELATRNAQFLLEALHPQDRLLRSWRSGAARLNAYLEDYAGLILGLLSLYQSDPQPHWYAAALQLADEMNTHFRDPLGGFFDTRDDHGPLLTRPKDIQDNATPAGSSLAATALLQLAAFSGQGEWRRFAEEMTGAVLRPASRYPTAFGKWLSAADFALNPVQEVAVIGDPLDPQTQNLIEVLWSEYRPGLVAALSDLPLPQGVPALLEGRPLVDARPTAYVCQQFVCQRPVNAPKELLAQLKQR